MTAEEHSRTKDPSVNGSNEPPDPMDQDEIEPYGDRPEVAVEGGQVVHGAELSETEVKPGSFAGVLGVPEAALADEQGDGIEVSRHDIRDYAPPPVMPIAEAVSETDSVSISIWSAGRCTSLERSWPVSGDSADFLDALRQLGVKAEELVEDDHL